MPVCPTTGVSRQNWKAVQYSVNNGSVLVVRWEVIISYSILI